MTVEQIRRDFTMPVLVALTVGFIMFLAGEARSGSTYTKIMQSNEKQTKEAQGEREEMRKLLHSIDKTSTVTAAEVQSMKREMRQEMENISKRVEKLENK
jgi:uncharacterized protein HemX